MKKIITLLCIVSIIIAVVPPASKALTVGTYKTESEYGLLDGFKINWKRKDKKQPFIEPREESSEFQKRKDLKYYYEDEYQRTKYMYDGKAII